MESTIPNFIRQDFFILKRSNRAVQKVNSQIFRNPPQFTLVLLEDAPDFKDAVKAARLNS